jgi:hypothetical protein
MSLVKLKIQPSNVELPYSSKVETCLEMLPIRDQILEDTLVVLPCEGNTAM